MTALSLLPLLASLGAQETVRIPLGRNPQVATAKPARYRYVVAVEAERMPKPRLEAVRRNAAFVKRLADAFAKGDACPKGQPSPTTLAAVPAEAREALRANLRIVTNRSVGDDDTVYPGVSGNVVVSDGTRTIRYPVDANRDWSPNE